ncbi:DUF4296 domain-containing protein [Labilibacter marinus]|uniref:DUF4296 domain-containing protein n=1 Tax=Labilibacter marinus TaxID=1477105 RepID=UPI001300CF8E|nr:DUF4296 domain-containing protein [Labilibacter marinus]
MISRVLQLLLVIVLISACSKFNVPEGFPEQKEFAEILAEVHFAEATINQLKIKNRSADSTANSYYHDVLNNYKLTQEKFDTIVSWYLTQPELYQKVYQDAIVILTKKEAQWEREVKEIEEEKERIRKEKLARNVWQYKKNYFISSRDTFDRRVPFEIKVDTIEKNNGFLMTANYQFLKGNQVKKPVLELVAMYEDSVLDTITYRLPNTHISTKVNIEVGKDSTLRILELYGLLIKHDTLEEVRARIKGIEFEYIPVPDSIKPIE